MKKVKYTLAGFLLFSIAFSVSAQTQKGKLLFGGGSNLSYSIVNEKSKDDTRNEDEGKTINVEFTPQTGYFIADNWAVGLEFPLNYIIEKDPSYGKVKTTTLSAVPFLIHYFGSGKIKPYLEAGAGLGLFKLKYEFDGAFVDPWLNRSDQKYKSSVFLYEVGGGIAVFLNENTAIDLGLGYASATYRSLQHNTSNSRTINSGFGFSVGFIIVL